MNSLKSQKNTNGIFNFVPYISKAYISTEALFDRKDKEKNK